MSTINEAPPGDTAVNGGARITAPQPVQPTTTTRPMPTDRPLVRFLWAATRLSLGWVFLWAFLDKMFGLGHETPSAESWLNGGNPTKGFLSGAVGPFAGIYQDIAGAGLVNVLFMAGLFAIGVALMSVVAMELTGSTYAAIGVLNPDRSGLERFVTSGIDAETHRAIGDLPRGQGVLGVLVSDPRPLRLLHVGEHPKSFGFPAWHPPMESFLGVPIMVRMEAWGNLYLTEKQDADEFTTADEQTAMVLADWAGIAIDNARLFEGVESRKDDLERAVQGLEATTAIVRAIGTETDLDRVLELIVKRGRDLIEARSLVLLLVDADELVVAASAGQVQSSAVGSRIPVDATAVGEVLLSGDPGV